MNGDRCVPIIRAAFPGARPVSETTDQTGGMAGRMIEAGVFPTHLKVLRSSSPSATALSNCDLAARGNTGCGGGTLAFESGSGRGGVIGWSGLCSSGRILRLADSGGTIAQPAVVPGCGQVCAHSRVAGGVHRGFYPGASRIFRHVYRAAVGVCDRAAVITRKVIAAK